MGAHKQRSERCSDMIAWFSQRITVNRSQYKRQFDRKKIAGTYAYKSKRQRIAANQTIDEQLDRDAKNAAREGAFDPKNLKKHKNWIFRQINLRRGQPEVRKKLLAAYSGRCAITDCNCSYALEAAHIYPYGGADTNHVQNGILLRSDIHTLFDRLDHLWNQVVLGFGGVSPNYTRSQEAHGRRRG